MKILLMLIIIFFVIGALIIIIAQILDDIIVYKDALQKDDSFFINLPLMRKASIKGKLTPTEHYLLSCLEMNSNSKDEFKCSPKIKTKCIITENGFEFWGYYDDDWNFIYGGKYMISIIKSVKKC